MTGTYDFCIPQGTDWSMTLTWTANGSLVNLTGWSAHLQIRPGTADGTSVIYADLSTSAGSIVLGGTAGTIIVSMPNAITSALSFTSASYDLKMINASSLVTRLLEGTVTLSPEVTV